MLPVPPAIPDPELELLINTGLQALRMAEDGALADGHSELVYGLRRPGILRDEGEPWAETLVTRYRLAVDGYCARFSVRWD